jgi:hypothetical protein
MKSTRCRLLVAEMSTSVLLLTGCLGATSVATISASTSGVGASSAAGSTGTGSGSGSSSGSTSGAGSSTGSGSGSTTGANPDAGCTASNCQDLFNCQLALEGEPRELEVCGVNGGSTTSYCVEACEADGNGALLDCIATQFGVACSTTPLPTVSEIEAACVGDAGPCGTSCMSCQGTCQATWVKCNNGCADAGVCLACEYQCSQTLVSCNGACPTD